jgi:hypothetical protein
MRAAPVGARQEDPIVTSSIQPLEGKPLFAFTDDD